MKWTTMIEITEPQRVVIAGLSCLLENGDVLSVVERPSAHSHQIDGKTATLLLETDKAQDVTPDSAAVAVGNPASLAKPCPVTGKGSRFDVAI